MAPPAKKPAPPPAVKKAEADARARKRKENEDLIKELTPDQVREFREAFKVSPDVQKQSNSVDQSVGWSASWSAFKLP